MGADIHVTLGFIKPTLAIEAPKDPLSLITTSNREQLSQVCLKECPGNKKPNQNYELFSFLAGVRGNVKSLVDWRKLDIATNDFLKRLHQAGPQYSQGGMDFEDFKWNNGINDHSYAFYPTATLTGFDYDQTVVRESSVEDDEHGDPIYHYSQDPDGLTYRDIFGKHWFDFLDYLKTENVDFVIFSFDS